MVQWIRIIDLGYTYKIINALSLSAHVGALECWVFLQCIDCEYIYLVPVCDLVCYYDKGKGNHCSYLHCCIRHLQNLNHDMVGVATSFPCLLASLLRKFWQLIGVHFLWGCFNPRGVLVENYNSTFAGDWPGRLGTLCHLLSNAMPNSTILRHFDSSTSETVSSNLSYVV